MRCSVSELAPGVNGLMTVIGRDDRSSARASFPAVAVTASTAAKMRNARNIEGSRCSSAAVRLALTLLHLRWGRQHQGIAKLDDLLDVIRIDDFERHQSTGRILDIDVTRLGDQMIQALERDLDDVIVGIVGNAEQRQPLGFDLIAKAQRGNLDFGLFAFERGRDAIEERAPLLFVELAGRHGDLLFGTRVQEWRMLSLSSWRTSRPRYRARCDSIKNLLRLGVVQSSRSSPRRADASEKRPARRIAGGEALFQTFIDLVFGRRSSQRLRRALAPRLRGPMPMLWNGPGHHVTGGLVATNTAEAHGRR